MIKNYGKTYNSGQNVLIETSQIFDEGGGKTLDKIIYPIGSVYISINSTDPHELFGGTWVQIKDAFLLACGNTYNNGSTGGNKEHQHLLPIALDNGIDNWSVMQWNAAFGYGTQSYWSPNRNILNNRATAEGIWLQQLKSKKESNMPPYLAVYMWYRTA